MIRSERIAKKINKEIKEWSKDRSKLIVAIDGYAGSGKTTIADFIAKTIVILWLGFDISRSIYCW